MPAPKNDYYGSSLPNWGPVSIFTAVTPSDSTDMSLVEHRGLLILTDGNLVWKGKDGPTTTHTLAVLRGEIYPFIVSRVMAATTAGVVAIG